MDLNQSTVQQALREAVGERLWFDLDLHERLRFVNATLAIARNAKAEAWDEGLDAGRFHWEDSRTFGEVPDNPYRD